MIHESSLDDERVPVRSRKHRVQAVAVSGVLLVSTFGATAADARMVGKDPHRMVGANPTHQTVKRMVGGMVG